MINKNLILSSLISLFVISNGSFAMEGQGQADQKDKEEKAQAAAQPPFQNPLDQQAEEKQKQQIHNDRELAAELEKLARESVEDDSDDADDRSMLKEIAANITGCAVGAFCGYVTNKMWTNFHTCGLLEFPATIMLMAAAYRFAERIGGSGPLSDIAMISTAVLLPPEKSSSRNKIFSGISTGGGISIVL